MRYSDLLLASAREKLGTDYKVAKYLDTHAQTLNNIRKGKQGFTSVQAARLARLIGNNEVEAVLMIDAEKARRPEDKKLLKELAVRCS